MQRALICPLQILRNATKASLKNMTLNKRTKQQQMATLTEQLEKLEKLTRKTIENELFNAVKRIEKVVFDLNLKQLENTETSKGAPLINKNKKYSGFYTKATEEIALYENPLLPKKAGNPYNFIYRGDFIKGFKAKVTTKGVDIYSNGTGSGGKKVFFDGYNDLFGLTDENLKEVINTRLLPFLQKYFRDVLDL